MTFIRLIVDQCCVPAALELLVLLLNSEKVAIAVDICRGNEASSGLRVTEVVWLDTGREATDAYGRLWSIGGDTFGCELDVDGEEIGAFRLVAVRNDVPNSIGVQPECVSTSC